MWLRIASAICSCASFALIIVVSTAALNQESGVVQSPVVTAAAAPERVRFISFDKITHIRLEVFSPAGERIFDSDFKSGDLLDWGLRDQTGQQLADGSYLCVVTVKDLSGRFSQKHGLVSLQKQQVTLQRAVPEQLPEGAARAWADSRTTQALGPVQDSSDLEIVNAIQAATGTGTVNRLAKWTETGGVGTLGDAAIFESSGLTFFGQNFSGQVAPLFPGADGGHVVEVGATGLKTPLVLAGGTGVMEFWKDLGGGTGSPTAAVALGMARPALGVTNDMVFSTFTPAAFWNERMRITSAGNVGIGTTAPSSRLTVAGVIQSTSGGIRFPDGTVQTTSAVGRTFAVCASSTPNNINICETRTCSCPNGSVGIATSPCTVTSDTGTCSATSCTNGSFVAHGQCCVCKP